MKKTKEITIKVEGLEWEKAIDQAFDRAIKKTKIDGFRSGKAPKEVFMKKYGKESLYMDAADICINEAYVKTLDENKDLEVVAQPELNLKSVEAKGIEFTITLTLKPTVKLGKYKGLKVKREEVEATKEEIKKTIHEMQHHYAESMIKDGAIALKDTAVIDFEGFKDGIAFEGGKGENYALEIGSQSFIPGFEEQLIGMNAGDVKDIAVTFPENYHSADLKGQPVVFKVKINEVKETMVPELNAAFYADLGMEGIDSKEALEKQVAENIKVRKEGEVENKYVDDLLEAASKNVEVDIPASMIDEESHRMVHQYEDTLKLQGLTLEQFFQFTNSNEEALKEQMKEEANKRVLFRLMLEAIAKAEKIEVTEQDASKEADTLATKYQMEKDEFLTKFGGLEMIKYDMQMRQAIEVLKK